MAAGVPLANRMRDLARVLAYENFLADTTLQRPCWRAAFYRAPRHAFVPDGIWVRHDGGDDLLAVDRRTNAHDERFWWDAVYRDYLIVTQVDDGRPHRVGARGQRPSCALSQPSYVFMMLGQLALRDDHRVLEIGTGTGWTAALLAARLGSGQVTSVEVDPVLAGQARASLAAVELAPTVLIGDGAHGDPAGGRYDRVSSTVAVRHVPLSWVRQTRPGGLILTPWRAGYDRGGGMLRLTVRADGTASGPFVGDGPFMEFRAHRFDGDARQRACAAKALTSAAESCPPREATTEPDALRAGHDLTFAIGVQVGATQHVRVDDGAGGYRVVLADDRGSWASASFQPNSTRHPVRQGGPRRLWDEVERAHAWWIEAGQPGPERFGLTVTARGQYTWFEDAEHGPRWPVLPPA
jgi:protein-L-isoaspartate O-methyltransferase